MINIGIDKSELIKEKLSDVKSFISDIDTWPVDALVYLSENNEMKMIIKWLGLLEQAGFEVSEYRIPQSSSGNQCKISVHYQGQKVLSMSNHWNFFYIRVYMGEDRPYPVESTSDISSKKYLLRYLEEVRDMVLSDLDKIYIVDLLLDIVEDL